MEDFPLVMRTQIDVNCTETSSQISLCPQILPTVCIFTECASTVQIIFPKNIMKFCQWGSLHCQIALFIHSSMKKERQVF